METEGHMREPYQEGVNAAKEGFGWGACPYTDNYRYKEWMRGWDSVPKRTLPAYPQVYESSLDYTSKIGYTPSLDYNAKG